MKISSIDNSFVYYKSYKIVSNSILFWNRKYLIYMYYMFITLIRFNLILVFFHLKRALTVFVFNGLLFFFFFFFYLFIHCLFLQTIKIFTNY